MEKGQTAGILHSLKGELVPIPENCEERKNKALFSIILANCHKPRVLFSTINLFLNPPQANCFEPSSETAESFLHFFVDKITTIRAHITPPSFNPSITFTSTAVFNHFEDVSLTSLKTIVSELKPSACPTDAIPPHLSKDVWDTVGPTIQSILKIVALPQVLYQHILNRQWYSLFSKKLI